MKKIQDAGVKHALFGLALAIVSDGNLSQTDLSKKIRIIDEEPYFEIEADQKWKTVIDGLKEWICAYNAAGEKVSDLLKSLDRVPNRANDIAAAAQEEMVGGDLNPKEIEKAIQDTKESVIEVLKVHEQFVAQLNRIPVEIDEI